MRFLAALILTCALAGAGQAHIAKDSFGNVLSDSNPALNAYIGFAGGLYDQDTGLVLFGYRDYLPDIGRWTAKDPILLAGGDLDLYAYCGQDPINRVDPDGTFWWFLAQALIAGVSGTIGAIEAVDALMDPCASGGEKVAKTALAVAGMWVPGGSAARVGRRAPNFVYRGLAAGENIVGGLVARSPGAGNSVASHVAGKRASQWISTTRSERIAREVFGEHGVVRVDLNRVISEVVDLSDGVPGLARNNRLSNWARSAQEVLIRDSVPADAVQVLLPGL